LTVFEGGGFDLIPNAGKRIETETLIGTSPLAPRLLRLLPVIPLVQHGPLQKRLCLLRIDSGDDRFTRTKVKNPTLAQNARMGHPNFKTQNFTTRNLNTRTSTPKISPPELQYPKPQHPNFNTQNLNTQTSKPGIRNHKEVCV
jgi:hypothetical protein